MVDTTMWRFRRQAKPVRVDPGRAHRFQEATDVGSGATASSDLVRTGGVSNALAVTASVRATRCAVPGCGRARDHDIHTPADA
jgi:hypothetical protein